MTGCRMEKRKEIAPTTKELVNKERGNDLQPDCSDDLQIRVKRALEAEDLCYNYETGFHYIKR